MGGIIEGFGQIALGSVEDMQERRRIADESAAERGYLGRMAADTLQRGAVETGRQRSVGSATAAQQRTAYAASGVDPTVGTAAQVQANTQGAAEIDAQTIKNNAAAEAWGFEQAKQRTFQEQRAKYEAQDRKLAGSLLGGYGKFIGGIAKMGGGG